MRVRLKEGRYIWETSESETVDLAALPPNLFLKFGLHVPITEEGILAFAQEFSLLNGETASDVSIKMFEELGEEAQKHLMTLVDLGFKTLKELKAQRIESQGESFKVWRKEIMQMRHAIKLWDVLQPYGSDQKKFISWSDGRFRIKDSEGRERTWRLTQNRNKRPSDAEFVRALELYLRGLIEYKLEGRVRAAYPSSSMKLEIEPTGLVGALWLQLARAVEGKIYFSKCVICGDIFTTNRRHTETCPQKDKPACRKEKKPERQATEASAKACR